MLNVWTVEVQVCVISVAVTRDVLLNDMSNRLTHTVRIDPWGSPQLMLAVDDINSGWIYSSAAQTSLQCSSNSPHFDLWITQTAESGEKLRTHTRKHTAEYRH